MNTDDGSGFVLVLILAAGLLLPGQNEACCGASAYTFCRCAGFGSSKFDVLQQGSLGSDSTSLLLQIVDEGSASGILDSR